ncbi:MAG: CDF family Co(II)/Ni(II) efflux transporter DmeF [Arenicella sp.]|nr:CDF family Co(II)/Ni(II) efflux transporter DmeF [Arenicella sp.]
MHTNDLSYWQHDHTFGQDQIKAGEKRTLFVVILTAVMMVIEIIAGVIYGSMALLADGLHMASHAAALCISLFAYIAARRLSSDRRFTFGTGKINSLAGFGSAILLAGFALVMTIESTGRLINPIPITFDQAIVVAVIGLIVNGVSAWLLAATPRDQEHGHGHGHGHHDHNLKAAYLHVLADALTSFLAIGALVAGKYWGAGWLDPAMGIVGAVLVARWSYGLLRETGRILLDQQANDKTVHQLIDAIEKPGTDRVSDIHVWSIGHGVYSAALAIVSDKPKPPDHYRALLPMQIKIVHTTIEVHQCPSHRQNQ